jgi:selenocysteine lyase/cysteine desulfurase
MTSSLERYLASFAEPVGYLNFASYGPPSKAVVETIGQLAVEASTGVPSAGLHAEDDRARSAISRLTGFPSESVSLTSSTSLGLLQVAYGLPRGEVLVSDSEFPSNLYAWWRAEEAGLIRVRTMPNDPGMSLAPVTPQRVADSLRPDTVAVAVSAVDFRTGARVDLEGLRAVIGDRLLIVDGIQAFGVVDEDWTIADALVVGGQKWLRAGWGTGFVALSARALDRLRPLLGGWTGVEGSSRYDGVPHQLLPGAARMSITNGSPFAAGALATALELLESVGVATVQDIIIDRTDRLINGLRAGGTHVLSPLGKDQRAGLVVAGFRDGEAAAMGSRLSTAGITVTVHEPDRVRFSVHATTTLAALDAAFTVLKGTS